MFSGTVRFVPLLLSLLFVPVLSGANQWDNYNEPSVNMQNVLTPGNFMYDAYGSWYDDGTGMMFHRTTTPSGQNHPSNPAGHGFVPIGESLLYHYDASFLDMAPAAAVGIVDGAFSLWDQAVNGVQGFRSPGSTLGFDWRRAALGEASYQINIFWAENSWEAVNRTFTNEDCGSSVACVFFGAAPEDAVPQLDLVFYNNYGTAAQHWASNFDTDLSQIPADPGPNGTWAHMYDLYSVALHELGHLAGLDDLYNLFGPWDGLVLDGFTGSTMGTSCFIGKDSAGACISDWSAQHNAWNPYRRWIDIGSLQGVIDLYTIPESSTLALAVPALLLSLVVTRRGGRSRAK